MVQGIMEQINILIYKNVQKSYKLTRKITRPLTFNIV